MSDTEVAEMVQYVLANPGFVEFVKKIDILPKEDMDLMISCIEEINQMKDCEDEQQETFVCEICDEECDMERNYAGCCRDGDCFLKMEHLCYECSKWNEKEQCQECINCINMKK